MSEPITQAEFNAMAWVWESHKADYEWQEEIKLQRYLRAHTLRQYRKWEQEQRRVALLSWWKRAWYVISTPRDEQLEPDK